MLDRAERLLFRHHEIVPKRRFLDLAEPPLRTRLLETGVGTPALFLHGGGTAALWAPLMAELPGVRVLAVDRPGSGSGMPFDYTGIDLRRHAVAFIDSTLDALGLDRAPIIANSMGGLWSLWYAMDRPERVAGMVLLGCPAAMPGSRFPPRGTADSSGAGRAMTRAVSVVGVLRGGTSAPRDGTPHPLVECLYRAELRPEHLATHRSMLEELARAREDIPELGLEAVALSTIDQPVIWVWGTADWYGHSGLALAAAAVMPNASVSILRAGHFPWFQDPEGCASAVLELIRNVVISIPEAAARTPGLEPALTVPDLA
jgi:pimeloyl-ACP methyl ester carboxylesterase